MEDSCSNLHKHAVEAGWAMCASCESSHRHAHGPHRDHLPVILHCAKSTAETNTTEASVPIYGIEASVFKGLASFTLLLQDDIVIFVSRGHGDKVSQGKQKEDFTGCLDASSVLSRTVKRKSIIYTLLSLGCFVIES